jgi:hypothetical protein
VRLENVWELQEDGNGTRGDWVTIYVYLCMCVCVEKERRRVCLPRIKCKHQYTSFGLKFTKLAIPHSVAYVSIHPPLPIYSFSPLNPSHFSAPSLILFPNTLFNLVTSAPFPNVYSTKKVIHESATSIELASRFVICLLI